MKKKKENNESILFVKCWKYVVCDVNERRHCFLFVSLLGYKPPVIHFWPLERAYRRWSHFAFYQWRPFIRALGWDFSGSGPRSAAVRWSQGKQQDLSWTPSWHLQRTGPFSHVTFAVFGKPWSSQSLVKLVFMFALRECNLWWRQVDDLACFSSHAPKKPSVFSRWAHCQVELQKAVVRNGLFGKLLGGKSHTALGHKAKLTVTWNDAPSSAKDQMVTGL